ncbi:autotransporter adhesin, partial [Bartonella fuyuanensis]|nr:autotransporter adhesin [Bartonella fuyuanensis]
MKKIYATRICDGVNYLHFLYLCSVMKGIFFIAMAAFFTNVSPVFSANTDFRNTFLEGVDNTVVSYPQSIISVAGLNVSSDKSKNNDLILLHTELMPKDNALSDYKTLSVGYDNSVINVLEEVNDSVRSIDLSVGSKKMKRAVPILGVANDLPMDSTTGLENSLVYGVQFGGNSHATPVFSRQIAQGRDLQGLGNPIIFGVRSQGDSHDAIVVGQVAETHAEQGIAIGLTALAGKNRDTRNSIAIGSSLTDSWVERERTVSVGNFSIAFGSKAHSYADDAIAIGYEAYVYGAAAEGIAIGTQTKAMQKFSIALGYGAEAVKENSIAIGNKVRATGKGSIAIGSEYTDYQESVPNVTEARGEYATALGSFAQAITRGAVALGSRARARQPYTVAIGFLSEARTSDGIALGTESVATVDRHVAGYNPVIRGDATDPSFVWRSTSAGVSVGDVLRGVTRQIGGVAAGTSDTDVVNVAQLKALQDSVVVKGLEINTTDHIFKHAIALGISSISMGNSANVRLDAEHAIAIGTHATVNVFGGIAIGQGAYVMASDEGAYVTASDEERKLINAIALGNGALAKGNHSIAIGTIAKVSDDHAIAFGYRAEASSKNSFAFGWDAKASDINALAFGKDVQALVQDGIALGSFSVANVAAGVGGYNPSIKANSDENTKDNIWWSNLGALSIGNVEAGKTRQIVGVSAGTNDTDAVNVAQLKELQNYVDKGWKLSVDGKNTKVVGIDDPVDLASGSKNFEIIKGVQDNKIQFDLAKDIALDSVKTGMNTLDKKGLVISGGPQITTRGIDAGGKKITNVGYGDISVDSHDAINGSQLYTLGRSFARSLGGDGSYEEGQ